MALGNYLSGLNLDPLSQEKLMSMAAPAPQAALVDDAGNPVAIGQSAPVPASTAPASPPGFVPNRGGISIAPLRDDGGKPVAYGDSSPVSAAPVAPSVTPPVPEVAPVQPRPMAQPQARGYMVPGGFEPGSRSVTTAKGLSREAFEPVLAGQDAAQGHGLMAAEREMEAAQIKGAADASYAEAFSKASAEAARENQRLASERREYVMREQEKLDALSQKAQAKVDPDLAKGPIGAQVLGAIGVALGTFGSSMTGGQNAALTIVQNNIDRNIRAQEANIANANKTLSNEQSLYRQNLDAFGDRERAVLATKMQMLEQAKGLADKQYAMAGTKTSEAAVEKFKGALSNEAAQARARIIEITEDKAQTHETENYRRAQYVGPATASPATPKELENTVTLPDGTTVQMPNKEVANKAIDKIQVVGELIRINKAAQQARERIKKLDPIGDMTEYAKEKGTLEDLENDKINTLSSVAGQGVVKEQEFARAMQKQSFLTQGVGVFKNNPIGRRSAEVADHLINRQIERAEGTMRSYVQAAGGTIVDRGFAVDAKGRKVPVGEQTGQFVQPQPALPPSGFKPLSGPAMPVSAPSLRSVTPMAKDKTQR